MPIDTTAPVPIHGDCHPGFTAVRDAFATNFAERGEVGASLCVLRRGELLVDLWGGWADHEHTVPFAHDTLVGFYSVGKALLATLLLRRVDQGEITLDTAIAEVWPEFGAHGKGRATIRHALCHQAGVPAIRQPLTDDDLFDWDTMTAALAATEPWWDPGTRHTYHTNTFGHLIGELVRRVTGEMPGDALRRVADEIEADVWFGVPAREQRRCADIHWDSPLAVAPSPAGLEGDALLNVLAHFNPPGYSSVTVLNTPRWRSAQIGSTAGHGSAEGVARFYAALLDDDRVLSRAVRDEASQVQSHGPCVILGEDVSFGLGFTPTTERRPLGPNPRSFGHFGTGGALGFADPDSGIAFGYVMNHVIPRWQSSRNRALIDALFDALPADP